MMTNKSLAKRCKLECRNNIKVLKRDYHGYVDFNSVCDEKNFMEVKNVEQEKYKDNKNIIYILEDANGCCEVLLGNKFFYKLDKERGNNVLYYIKKNNIVHVYRTIDGIDKFSSFEREHPLSKYERNSYLHNFCKEKDNIKNAENVADKEKFSKDFFIKKWIRKENYRKEEELSSHYNLKSRLNNYKEKKSQAISDEKIHETIRQLSLLFAECIAKQDFSIIANNYKLDISWNETAICFVRRVLGYYDDFVELQEQQRKAREDKKYYENRKNEIKVKLREALIIKY